VTLVYVDTNYLYVHLRATPGATSQVIDDWRSRVLAELGQDPAVISALVLDELAYRLVLAWLRDDGERDPLRTYRADSRAVMATMRTRLTRTWQAVDELLLELQPTDRAVVEEARALMADPGMAPRDAFHAAHALAADCSVIASSDTGFDHVRGLRRLGPDATLT
jgi:predicted nucleic acid-binding protein